MLPIEDLVQIEVTSEDRAHPIESALVGDVGTGWRASQPGEQLIRLVFDEPQDIQRIHLVFEEPDQERLQEFSLRWSSDRGATYQPVVRQQFSFSPSGSAREVEDYSVISAARVVLFSGGRGAGAAAVSSGSLGAELARDNYRGLFRILAEQHVPFAA